MAFEMDESIRTFDELEIGEEFYPVLMYNQQTNSKIVVGYTSKKVSVDCYITPRTTRDLWIRTDFDKLVIPKYVGGKGYE